MRRSRAPFPIAAAFTQTRLARGGRAALCSRRSSPGCSMTVQASTPLPTSSDPSLVGALHDAHPALRIAPRVSSRARLAWIGLAALTILAAMVFWIFDALPFQDLPAHAGLIA